MTALGSLAAGSVCAEQAAIYPAQNVLTFRGLDSKSSPTAVQDGRAQDLLNVKLDVTGALRKRDGYSVVGSILDVPDIDNEAIQGVYYTKYSSGTEDTLAVCGGRWYRYDTTLDPDDWSRIWGETGTTGKNYQYVWTTALDTIIATNDQDKPLKYTEGGHVLKLDTTDLTDELTKSKCIVWYKNYLIFGNTVEDSVERSTRFRWSNVGTIETWSDEDFIDIATLGGQEIEAFAVLYDNLYVFLTNSIYQISLVGGDEIFKVSKVVDGVGCIAKNSVQPVILLNSQQGLVFLAKDKKVYFFDGMRPQYLSLLIEPTMGELNASRLQYAVSAKNGTDYYLAAATGSSTENDLLLDFQYEIGEWLKHDQIDANAMARVYDTNNIEQTYFGQYGGFICKMDDTALDNDIDGHTGTVSGVDVYTTGTASSIQMVYDNTSPFTHSGLRAGILKIISGTGSGQERRIVENTISGVGVETAFSTTPDTTSVYSIGAIDGYYTAKWYDCGEPARLKGFGELWYWADAETDTDIDVTYATDFASDIDTQSVSLSGTSTDAIWGSAIWGTSLWGGVDYVFRQTKFEDTGRYLKFKLQDDDIDDDFRIHGFNLLYWRRDYQ